jgi:hypothetical protein
MKAYATRRRQSDISHWQDERDIWNGEKKKSSFIKALRASIILTRPNNDYDKNGRAGTN